MVTLAAFSRLVPGHPHCSLSNGSCSTKSRSLVSWNRSVTHEQTFSWESPSLVQQCDFSLETVRVHRCGIPDCKPDLLLGGRRCHICLVSNSIFILTTVKFRRVTASGVHRIDFVSGVLEHIIVISCAKPGTNHALEEFMESRRKYVVADTFGTELPLQMKKLTLSMVKTSSNDRR